MAIDYRRIRQLLACLIIVAAQEYDVPSYTASPTGALQGELRIWHKITIGFEGPETNETAIPNPFLDYRLDVLFSHESHESLIFSHENKNPLVVPGFYAANGNAANNGTMSGNVWLVHFAPMMEGTWNWQASFTTGPNVAIKGGNVSAGYFDGASGSLMVGPTNKPGRDLRSKGLLAYVGQHHLQFAGTGEFFLKAGADSPENFLAFEDFDNTPNTGGFRKTWSPHLQDYRQGDPTWKGGLGKGIIGAVNYLASKGMNVFSFLTMNIGGDDRNAFPFISRNKGDDRLRYDISKLAQWEVLFEHADHFGMYLHFKTQEQENDQLLDGGELGTERKLYYRELVARFSHHLALNWNLGEENTNTDAQRKAFASHFRLMDPYNHPIVVHTFPNNPRSVYNPLLGFDDIDGASLQVHPNDQFERALEWIQKSAQAGRKWIVANDEQGSADLGVLPDEVDPSHDEIRKKVLWANFMAGGAGVEYYFGYQYASSDLTCEDLRSRDNMWTQSKQALDFFKNYQVPFWNMTNANSRVTQGNFCLAEGSDNVIVIYLPNGGNETIDLSGANIYRIHWYDPLLGGELQIGSVTHVNPNHQQSLGSPPYSPDHDWVVRLEREVPESTNTPTSQPTASSTAAPTLRTASEPTSIPPSVSPSSAPTYEPSQTPTGLPTVVTSDKPSDTSSLQPSVHPTSWEPSLQPRNSPTNKPTSNVGRSGEVDSQSDQGEGSRSGSTGSFTSGRFSVPTVLYLSLVAIF
eukprot:scaffold3077_cov162-Amphora_coffeaeformis.AAC.33